VDAAGARQKHARARMTAPVPLSRVVPEQSEQ
jgi:hypothetical protein